MNPLREPGPAGYDAATRGRRTLDRAEGVLIGLRGCSSEDARGGLLLDFRLNVDHSVDTAAPEHN